MHMLLLRLPRALLLAALLCASALALPEASGRIEAQQSQQAMHPADIYARVAPAIAYIKTPTGSGSGILIDAEHVLTNSHVVWPYDTVRVRFPDGTLFDGAPVVAIDRLADMALIRIQPVAITPARFADPAALRPGARLYLIGYPAEIEDDPDPTIIQGLLSRRRIGGPAALTYLQTDAPATAGNSGGPVVSEAGDVVAITQLRFPGSDFTLGADASQVLARMLPVAGDYARDGIGDRRLPSLAATVATPHVFGIEGFYAQQTYYVPPGPARTVAFEARGGPTRMDAYTLTGRHDDNGLPIGVGVIGMRMRAEAGTAYLVVIRANTAERRTYTVTSSEPIRTLQDLDSGRTLSVGAHITAALDFRGARQYFYLPLTKDQKVTITAASILIDPFLVIDYPGNPEGPLDTDDDSAKGLLGSDAKLTFTAPTTSTYLISLRDVANTQSGAYTLTVEAAE